MAVRAGEEEPLFDKLHRNLHERLQAASPKGHSSPEAVVVHPDQFKKPSPPERAGFFYGWR
jgi:hypothetical protein